MPESRPLEVLAAGGIYTSREFRRRMRIGESCWRRLKQQGLKVHRVGKTCLVLTSDFENYLRSRCDQETER